MTSADIAAMTVSNSPWRGRDKPVSLGPSPLAKGAGRRESHWSATVGTNAEEQRGRDSGSPTGAPP